LEIGITTETLFELVGYTASLLVVVSLAMSSIIKLRVINLVGAVAFALYGVLIGSVPIMLTNVIIAGIDIWFLRRELTTREQLTVIAVSQEDPFLDTFLRVQSVDIERFHPGFSLAEASADVTFLMLRDANPAGVFVGRRSDNATMTVVLDYVAPPYRDLKSGSSLYGHSGERFVELGITNLRVPYVHPKQRDYFFKMHFVPEQDGSMTLTLPQS